MNPSHRKLAALAILAVLPAVTSARADVVTDWNIVAINATAIPPNSILQSRVLAIAHQAMYDAVRAIGGNRPAYAADLKAASGASVDAGAATAAHRALVKLVPSQRSALDAALNATLSGISDARAKADGVEIGAQVADALIVIRNGDRSDAVVPFNPKPGAGRYRPTYPHNLPAILPQWGGVTPFVLKGLAGLETKGPPAPASAEYLRDFDEVKSVGARDSKTRTPDQTAAAIFWTVQTAVPWHAAARAAAITKGNSVTENARLFAMLSMATADSQIACFAEKYKHVHWRPIAAVREAATTNVRNLSPDPKWEPLLGTPPHPEYPSAHACFSGAAEVVLRSFFDSDAVQVDVTYPPVFGVTRTYTKFSQISKEVNDARVWAGIHFRSADTDGYTLGRKVGEIAARAFPISADRF
jgi:hypothetical protein